MAIPTKSLNRMSSSKVLQTCDVETSVNHNGTNAVEVPLGGQLCKAPYTFTMNFGVYQLSQDFVIVVKCKQDSKVVTYSSFTCTELHGYGVQYSPIKREQTTTMRSCIDQNIDLRLVHTTLQICCNLRWMVAFRQGDRKFSISYNAAVHCKFSATSDQSERALTQWISLNNPQGAGQENFSILCHRTSRLARCGCKTIQAYLRSSTTHRGTSPRPPTTCCQLLSVIKYVSQHYHIIRSLNLRCPKDFVEKNTSKKRNHWSIYFNY